MPQLLESLIIEGQLFLRRGHDDFDRCVAIPEVPDSDGLDCFEFLKPAEVVITESGDSIPLSSLNETELFVRMGDGLVPLEAALA